MCLILLTRTQSIPKASSSTSSPSSAVTPSQLSAQPSLSHLLPHGESCFAPPGTSALYKHPQPSHPALPMCPMQITPLSLGEISSPALETYLLTHTHPQSRKLLLSPHHPSKSSPTPNLYKEKIQPKSYPSLYPTSSVNPSQAIPVPMNQSWNSSHY